MAQDVAEGRLVKLAGPGLQAEGMWNALTLPEHVRATSAVAELARFVTHAAGDPGDAARAPA